MKIIYRYLVNFICLFYSNNIRRKKRKELLQIPSILRKDFKTKKNIKKIINSEVAEKSILIVEPNPYHFEIQPGYCKYFQDLGYEVDVIAQPNLREDFAYQYYPKVPKIYYLSLKYQKKALKLSKIKNYDFVFFATSVISSDNLRTSYVNWLGFEPQAKHGIFMVEHNVIPFVKDYGHEKYIEQNRSFTLAGQYNIPMLNPHYFGNIKPTTLSGNNIFVAIVNENQNIELLFNACKNLINQNITNFSVIIAGRSVVDEIPDNLQNYISRTGIINFTKLWEIYNNADFIIPMLNPEIDNQLRFKDGSVTGSWQIILGFSKPAIIHKDFSNFYRLNKNNALIFESNSELSVTMNKAININSYKYRSLQSNIKELSDIIYNESINNLKLSIDNIRNNYPK